MYPILFQFGSIEVSSFSVMVLISFLVAYILSGYEFKRVGLDDTLLDMLLVASVIGGLGGAKLLFLYQQATLSDLIAHPIRYAASGFTFLGGLIGATILVFLVTQYRRVSFLNTTDIICPALILGYAIGRIGCLLVGDDYGAPSDLPWAMAFPNGAPPTFVTVHPTQIYDTLCMLIAFAFLWKIRKNNRFPGWITAITFIILGGQRFLMEFLRNTTPSFIPGISQAQVISTTLVIIGIIMLYKLPGQPREQVLTQSS